MWHHVTSKCLSQAEAQSSASLISFHGQILLTLFIIIFSILLNFSLYLGLSRLRLYNKPVFKSQMAVPEHRPNHLLLCVQPLPCLPTTLR